MQKLDTTFNTLTLWIWKFSWRTWGILNRRDNGRPVSCIWIVNVNGTYRHSDTNWPDRSRPVADTECPGSRTDNCTRTCWRWWWSRCRRCGTSRPRTRPRAAHSTCPCSQAGSCKWRPDCCWWEGRCRSCRTGWLSMGCTGAGSYSRRSRPGTGSGTCWAEARRSRTSLHLDTAARRSSWPWARRRCPWTLGIFKLLQYELVKNK